MPRRCALIFVILMIVLAGAPGNGKTAVPKKKPAAKKTAAVKGPAPVPGKRVIADFNLAYKAPDGLKTGTLRYIGVARNEVDRRGENNVPVQIHTVLLTGTLTDCGLTMKNSWEARYYRLETEWIFQDITLKTSRPEGKPKAKLPPLDDATALRLITEGVAAQYGSPVQEVTLLGKKGSWELCVPTYRVTTKSVIASKDDVQNTVTTYECLMVATIVRKADAWTYVTAGCVYRGKDIPDCHIGTMCRTVSGESTIPPISDEEALAQMRSALEREYGLKKNNIAIERFTMIGRMPAEVFGTSIPCSFNAVIVIDEYQESTSPGGTRTAERVRAVYECVVSGNLRYSLREKKWGGVIASCCAAGSGECGTSCSTPYKGCRRLGIK